MLVQISNIAFALGQIYYKKTFEKLKLIKSHQIFALVYSGAFVIATFAYFIQHQNFSAIMAINLKEWITLIYLGVIASGLGFYFWNLGVTKCNIGVIAIMNNLKIPLSIAVSLLVFGEHFNIIPLIISLASITLLTWFAKTKN